MEWTIASLKVILLLNYQDGIYGKHALANAVAEENEHMTSCHLFLESNTKK